MVSKGKTSSKGETPLVDLWLNQFERQDRGDAKTLLAAIRNVTANEFHDAMTEIVRSRVIAQPTSVGLYVESERGHRGGKVYRLFKENGKKRVRAIGSGPPVIRTMRTVDPEVGSEGVVAQIVSGVFRQHRKLATIHPGPDTIRRRKIRRFILVTDFIGSGQRTSRYLDPIVA